jgi:hypothetical protein
MYHITPNLLLKKSHFFNNKSAKTQYFKRSVGYFSNYL